LAPFFYLKTCLRHARRAIQAPGFSKWPQLHKQKWQLRNSTIFRCAKNRFDRALARSHPSGDLRVVENAVAFLGFEQCSPTAPLLFAPLNAARCFRDPWSLNNPVCIDIPPVSLDLRVGDLARLLTREA
jgi:hypothetical protein